MCTSEQSKKELPYHENILIASKALMFLTETKAMETMGAQRNPHHK